MSARDYYGSVRCDGKQIPPSYAEGLTMLRGLEPEALADLLAAAGSDGDDDLDVDVGAYCDWLETGENKPCPASPG